jgi:hypothetical protein
MSSDKAERNGEVADGLRDRLNNWHAKLSVSLPAGRARLKLLRYVRSCHEDGRRGEPLRVADRGVKCDEAGSIAREKNLRR